MRDEGLCPTDGSIGTSMARLYCDPALSGVASLLSENKALFHSNLVRQAPKLAFGHISIALHETQKYFEAKQSLSKISASHDLVSSSAGMLHEAIFRLRSSYAHPFTKIHEIDSQGYLAWNICFGRTPGAIVIDGRSFGCEYHDDCAVIFGDNSVLFFRHLALCHEYYARALLKIFPHLDYRLGFAVVDQHSFWTEPLNALRSWTPPSV